MNQGSSQLCFGSKLRKQANRDPLLGGIFENMVMTEIYKAIHNRGLPIDASFFRDSNGNEVDFVLERQRIPVPVEIKASTAFSLDFARGIRYFMGLVEEARPGWIVYGGEERFEGGDYTAIGFAEAAQVVLDR